MTIEHRYSARHPIDLRVSIHYRGRRFYSASARDLSDQGMALHVQNLTLPVGTLVELAFDRPDRQWLVAAIVIHHEGPGVGVMFCEPQPELYQHLTKTERMPSPWPVSGTIQVPRVARSI